MTILDTSIYSPNVPSPVTTGATNEHALAHDATERIANRDGWNDVIDKYLVQWGRNPSLLNDEDIVPPSKEIIDRACTLAREFRDLEFSAPLRVVPDTDGGISFERRDGDTFQSLNVLEDGGIELLIFDNCKLVDRHRLA